MSTLIYQETPTIELGSNRFINVPVVFQYHDTPLIEFVQREDAGFEIQISIYDKNGTYMAKVKGSQMYGTPAGERAGIKVRHPDKMTVVEMGHQTLFELRRDDPAALKTYAELYTPDGTFLKTSAPELHRSMGQIDIVFSSGPFPTGVVTIKDFTNRGGGIGIHLMSNGVLGLGMGSGSVTQALTGDPTPFGVPGIPWMFLKAEGTGSGGTVSNIRICPPGVSPPNH